MIINIFLVPVVFGFNEKSNSIPLWQQANYKNYRSLVFLAVTWLIGQLRTSVHVKLVITKQIKTNAWCFLWNKDNILSKKKARGVIFLFLINLWSNFFVNIHGSQTAFKLPLPLSSSQWQEGEGEAWWVVNPLSSIFTPPPLELVLLEKI